MLRIIERTKVNKSTAFVIQTRYWFFGWRWADCVVKDKTEYWTMLGAYENLDYFNGTKNKDRQVTDKEITEAIMHQRESRKMLREYLKDPNDLVNVLNLCGINDVQKMPNVTEILKH